ncbi:MAG: copper ion binding protein [Thermoleophilia bacterium]
MTQVTLSAPKMSCNHCKMAVESAAGALEGVSSISADPESKNVDISYDESVVSLDAIKQAITAAGYPVE